MCTECQKTDKLRDFGDAQFPELLDRTPEDLYHTNTEDEFAKLTNAYIRENQILKVAEIARNFTFRWNDLNSINECIHFHSYNKPDPPGYGN